MEWRRRSDMCWTQKWLRGMATWCPSRCMRPSRDTRPMWPRIRDWTEKVQVLRSVNRRLPASPWGTSLDFTRQQHSLPPPVGRMMRLITLKVPHHLRTVTPRRLNLLTRKMRGCTSLATSRRLYQMILFCRSRWPVPCKSRRWTPGGASPVIGPATSHGITKNGRKKWNQAPPGAGAYSKPSSLREDQTKTHSARSARASRGVERVPYLNPDAFSRFIGPKNWGQALINDELTTCLLDNGAQLNFITPAYAVERGMDIMSLDRLAQEIGGPLPLIAGMGSSLVEPTRFVFMNVKVPCIQGYDEDQVTLVMDDPGIVECPVILGTSTLYRVMEVIKESEISKLAILWSSFRILWLMWDVMDKLGQVVVNDVANKPIAPLDVDEIVRVASKCTVPLFGHKVIHGKVNLVLHGCRLNVMTHGLEKRSPSLPLGIDVQTTYSTLANGSHQVSVILRKNTQDWLEIKKGVPIARMVTANAIPKVTHILPAGNPHEQSTLTEAERQELLLEKLDLTGLEAWPTEQAEKARSLLREYHSIFSLEKHDTGHTKAAKHKIVLKDPDTPPFKERFCRIPPPQLDEVCAYLKMMLDAGVIRPSNSPWCNAVVLVRKKDGSLCFCIDFRRLNSLTVKDSHPLPHFCETLESLAGAAHYTTIDMNSGFWQVPMDDELKQYTAFTLGSMGLYECESMPFGLCNAPPTFQRLMLNCLGELNLMYCLIYLDDVIIFSRTEEEHLERMRVVFDRFWEQGLKLKPSKCEVFQTEINYLAHHVSKRGVLPSKKNLEAIAQCPPLDTYTKVKSFVGLVGHYRCFIKGFANVAAPLYDLTSGKTKTRSQSILTYRLRLVRLLTASKLRASKPPSWPFPILANPSCWKQMPPAKAWELCCRRSSLMDDTILLPMPAALWLRQNGGITLINKSF